MILALVTVVSISVFVYSAQCWYFRKLKPDWVNTASGFVAIVSYIPVFITMCIWGLRIADISIKWFGCE